MDYGFSKHLPGERVIKYTQDVEPFIEATAKRAALLDKRENWWYVGTVPDVVQIQWMNECGHPLWSPEYRQYAIEQLNKREYAKLNPNRLRLDPHK